MERLLGTLARGHMGLLDRWLKPAGGTGGSRSQSKSKVQSLFKHSPQAGGMTDYRRDSSQVQGMTIITKICGS
jgi:hypothetical protein